MDLITSLRILAHLLWVGWMVTVLFLAYPSRGKQLRITHVPIGMAALALLAIWFGFLLLSVRNVGLMPREMIIPLLASLEMGGAVCAWGWLVLCGSRNYRIEFRRNDKTALLIVAWLTVLFLA